MHKKRFILAVFVLFCVSETIGGREVSNYWRSVMKDEDMPEAIKGLVLEDGEKWQTGIAREFQVRPNLIIYHRSQDHRQKHVDEYEVKGPNAKNEHGA